MNRWIRYYGGGLPQQIMPIGDLVEHVQSVNCLCRPKVSLDGEIVTHHAADGREYSEPDMRPEFQEKPQ